MQFTTVITDSYDIPKEEIVKYCNKFFKKHKITNLSRVKLKLPTPYEISNMSFSEICNVINNSFYWSDTAEGYGYCYNTNLRFLLGLAYTCYLCGNKRLTEIAIRWMWDVAQFSTLGRDHEYVNRKRKFWKEKIKKVSKIFGFNK